MFLLRYLVVFFFLECVFLPNSVHNASARWINPRYCIQRPPSQSSNVRTGCFPPPPLGRAGDLVSPIQTYKSLISLRNLLISPLRSTANFRTQRQTSTLNGKLPHSTANFCTQRQTSKLNGKLPNSTASPDLKTKRSQYT